MKLQRGGVNFKFRETTNSFISFGMVLRGASIGPLSLFLTFNSVPARRHEYKGIDREVHDPGLTPMGKEESRLFPGLYEHHIKPTLIVTSPLRRCLQTTTIAFGPMIRSGEIRAIAHPALQEISDDACDTGTPLNILREEFPDIQFTEELFPPYYWPRTCSIPFRKSGMNRRQLLFETAIYFREWLRKVKNREIIVVTHSDFVHFLFDEWIDSQDEPYSTSEDLDNAEAIPRTLASKCSPEEFCPCPLGIHTSPNYKGFIDENAAELDTAPRDCGIFTRLRVRVKGFEGRRKTGAGRLDSG
jgi:broad specificity phosphatase PhoE